MRLSCRGTCKIFGLGEMLVSYYWLSNTLFSSIKLIKPHDILVLLMFICVWLCFYGDQHAQRLGKWFLVILYCFMYKFVFLNIHIYISGQLMGRYFFCAGVSALQGRFTLAASVIRGLRSTFWVSLEFSSPSRCLCRFFRCCFTGCSMSKELLPSIFSSVWISSSLAMSFPSLIRTLILGSISEQSVGNCSKRFETHFTNGPIYA